MGRAARSSSAVFFRAVILGTLAFAGLSPLPCALAVDVDRIDFVGVTALDRAAVESSLELQVGDRFDRARALKTAELLTELYRRRGYQAARISVETLREQRAEARAELVVQFRVDEGPPTRVASVTVKVAGLPELGELASRLELRPGELLDQDRVADARRLLGELLVGQDFLGSTVEEVRADEAPAPPEGGPSGAKLPAARWVALHFGVSPGDRATFGFRGNRVFTRQELVTFVEDQRALGFGSDYIEAIKKRIEEEYRSRGFALARIVPLVFEPGRSASARDRHVTFEIDEGPRVVIEGVEFDGNSAFSSEELRMEFFALAPITVQRGTYSERDTQRAAELLIEWIRSRGHLSAKLVAVNRGFLGEKRPPGARQKGMREAGKVGLTIYLYEGERTTVRSIRVEGGSQFGEAETARLLGVSPGKPLDLFAFNAGLEKFRAAYRARGFLQARILNEETVGGGESGAGEVVRYSPDNREADIVLEMSEGPRFRVGEISVEGLVSTRPEVLFRELDFRKGEILEEGKLLSSEAKLRRLGIFSEVSIRKRGDPRGSPVADLQDLLVSVQEGAPGIVAGGAGFRQDLGVRAFGQTGYTNLFGRNHELNLGLNLNYREWGGVFCGDDRGPCFLEGQAQLSYLWPWFLGDRTSFRPRLQVERTRYVQFDLESFSAQASWERRLFSRWPVFGGLTYSLERTRQFNAIGEEDRSLTIGALIPSFRLDFRDNPLSPTRGFFAFSSFELADPVLGSQSEPKVAFYRFQLRADQFVPVSRAVSLYLSFRTGYARNNVVPPAGVPSEELGRYALPLAKQFALGGVTSLRGFQEQQFNFQQFNVLGVISYVNYRTQLDLPFAGALRFGPFLDAGNLLIDRPGRPSYSLTHDLRFGSGFGFHYQSPVGPVNLDVGFALGPVPVGQSRHRFYFSIGLL